jgi:hypothetical protein
VIGMSRRGITAAVLFNMKALCDVAVETDEETTKASG